MSWLTLYPLQAELLIRFDGSDRRNRDSEDSRDTAFEAGVGLRQYGHVVDPLIANFVLELEPSRTWGSFGTESLMQDRNDEFLSYLFSLDLLDNPDFPVGVGIHAQQTSNLNTGSLGSRSESENAARGINARWRNRAFPMVFSFEDRSRTEEFRSGVTQARSLRDEDLQTWRISGRSSKLRMQLEHQSLNDKVPSRDRDFDIDRLYLNHRLHWGTDSELRSRLDFRDRTGFNPYRRTNVEESARIYHGPALSSLTTYRFDSVTQVFKSDEHTGDISVTHKLYGNLSTTAQLHGRVLSSDNRDRVVWRTGLRSGYKKEDLFGIPVQASVGYYYQETDLDSRAGLLEVLEEPHEVPLAGNFILDNLFVLPETVLVSNSAGTETYAEGIDYSLSLLGNDLTELRAIPGGRIVEGDRILVSYKAELSPSQEFSSTQFNYGFGFNLDWMYFSHSSSKLDETLLSGLGEGFLHDTRTDTTNLQIRWSMGDIESVFSAQRQFYTLRDFESLSYTYRQRLSRRFASGTFASLNLTASTTEDSIRDSDLFNLELAVDWQPLGRLAIRSALGAWKNTRVDRGGGRVRQEDEFISASLSLRWWYRKVNLDLLYSHNQRTTDQRQTAEDRLMFNIRRRF